MAQKSRQTKMFAAEDYMAVYDSYLNANFQAYDFDTIRQNMVDYIRTYYPESFNDWVESSEFVALLDVIAQFGHNLAFRNDLNSRNNFLSTSERQESVFKLAEFLNYQPKRNVPAMGELKITSIKTNEPVIGSDGNSLAGREIRFENTGTIGNLDDFVSVMDALLTSSNPFGSPRNVAVVNGQNVEFYTANNKENQIVFEFQGLAQGSAQSCYIFGATQNNGDRIVESSPYPQKGFGLYYKNDNRGVSSNNTGFFVGFKQGKLSFEDFNITEPMSNLTLDISVDNINQGDVWVQEINNDGSVKHHWTSVDSVNSYNEIYNNVSNENRRVFSVKTRENGQVSVLFPDKDFGELPRNLVRVWYRQGINESYTLRPDDIGTTKFNIRYTGIDGNDYTAVLTAQLRVAVNNASAAETIDDIKVNAPRVYSSQDRMVTSDDYNDYLLSKSTQIKKIKAINRTHSGHSRFIELRDPTGSYSNVKLYANDGAITTSTNTNTVETTTNNPAVVFEKYIKPILGSDEIVNLYFNKFDLYLSSLIQQYIMQAEKPIWQSNDGLTGYFTYQNQIISNLSDDTYMKFLKNGSVVKFVNPLTSDIFWAKVSNVYNNGLGVNDSSGEPLGLRSNGTGAFALDAVVPNGCEVEFVYPPFNRQFTNDERIDILANIETNSVSYIWYNIELQRWEIVEEYPEYQYFIEDQDFSWPNNNWPENTDGDNFGPNGWLIKVEKKNEIYEVSYRSLTYKMTSEQIQFSNTSNEYVLSSVSGKKKRDEIQIFNSLGDSVSKFYVYGYDVDSNGIYDQRNVKIVLIDNNGDSRPDNPDAYRSLLGELDEFRFEWSHYPDVNEIIDPGMTNIIDVFVLTNSYDLEFRNWLTNTNIQTDMPLPPTIDELNAQFDNIDGKKSMSDTVIYRPVKYKILFGDEAISELRGKFKVVKTPNVSNTDSEIKSMIVDALNEFFDISNWDFGETFYFTELAAFVHRRLSGIISSFVVVPEGDSSVFGKLFQVTPDSDELFIPDVSSSDITIVDKLTNENIKSNR
jgi:hypothetical protein